MSLNGKIALVTGASRGIGRACALKLAEKGATVAINYTSNEEKAAEVKDEIIKNGGNAILVKANVGDFNDVEKMFEKITAELGTVDILINNAGVTEDALLVRMKEEQWDKVIEINLKGVYNCCKFAIKDMLKKRSGTIINIASVVGLVGNPGQTNYAASKAGVIGFSKSLAKEVASRNIRVNCVAPGYIQTDMTEKLNDKFKDKLREAIPMGRLGKVDDISEVVLFLASDAASYITGQVIAVDGGMTM